MVRWALRIICDLCPVPSGTLLPLQPFSVTLCMFVSCMYVLVYVHMCGGPRPASVAFFGGFGP